MCSCFQFFLLLDFDQSDWSQPLKTQFDLRTAIDQFAVFCCRSLEFDALTCLLIRSSCLCCIQFWLVNHHRLGTHSSAEDARFWHHVILNLHILEFYCPIFSWICASYLSPSSVYLEIGLWVSALREQSFLTYIVLKANSDPWFSTVSGNRIL